MLEAQFSLTRVSLTDNVTFRSVDLISVVIFFTVCQQEFDKEAILHGFRVFNLVSVVLLTLLKASCIGITLKIKI